MSQIPNQPMQQPVQSMRIAAGVCGIVIGGLGVHRFIIGDTTGGLICIGITVVTCGFGQIIGLIEGIIYLTKTDEQFIQEYQVGKKAWF